jgi:AcrR family transcriptional regulator
MKDPWIQAGYTLFAGRGPAGLKIDVLAKRAGVSKSSFYHHFADLEGFIESLLAQHMKRVRYIADLERACPAIVPDLLQILLTVEEDLLFNRQLRHHRAIPTFRNCIRVTNNEIADALLPQWSAAFGLADRPHVARVMLDLVIDNFYLQLTEQPLTYEWLLNYIDGLRLMVRDMTLTK